MALRFSLFYLLPGLHTLTGMNTKNKGIVPYGKGFTKQNNLKITQTTLEYLQLWQELKHLIKVK